MLVCGGGSNDREQHSHTQKKTKKTGLFTFQRRGREETKTRTHQIYTIKNDIYTLAFTEEIKDLQPGAA